jgi:hypothetical protein
VQHKRIADYWNEIAPKHGVRLKMKGDWPVDQFQCIGNGMNSGTPIASLALGKSSINRQSKKLKGLAETGAKLFSARNKADFVSRSMERGTWSRHI